MFDANRSRLWVAGVLSLLMGASAPNPSFAGRLDAADPGFSRHSAVAFPSRPSRRVIRAQRPDRVEKRAASRAQGRAAARAQGQRAQTPRKSRNRGERRAAPAITIEAPSYYDYRADPMVAVDFQALLERPQLASLQPGNLGMDFASALAGLDSFELSAEEPIAKALLAFYAKHPRFIWVDGLGPSSRAAEAIRVLSEAEAFGLESSDYAVAPPAFGAADAGDADRLRELVQFEMALSARVLRYLRDARGGRVDPNRISGYHDFALKPFDGLAELARMERAKNIRAALEGAHPRNAEFAALRTELARLQDGVAKSEEQPLDWTLTLKPGQRSADLPKVVRLMADELAGTEDAEVRAGLEGHGDSDIYGEALVPVVKAIQERKGLRPDGIIGERTVAALAGVSHAERVKKVELAMEQLRWLPRELGDTHVFINQPAFTATFMENGTEKLSMRVVIGTSENQTSFFYDEIEQVDYNPYWGVPQSILINEMLPRLRRDPGYLDRAGYEVSDSKGRRIRSSDVNWWSYSPKSPLSVRQTPSEANALGELKILFPNKHAIYMHDTPAKDLFAKDVRAFSHGCIRLHDPRGMAAAVLGTTVEHVESKLAQGHSTEKLQRRIPVYVSYFTAWPDAEGAVRYFTDVYGRDTYLDAALAETAEVRAAGS